MCAFSGVKRVDNRAQWNKVELTYLENGIALVEFY